MPPCFVALLLTICAHFPDDKRACISSLFCRVRYRAAFIKQVFLPREIPLEKCLQPWTTLASLVGLLEQRGPTYFQEASCVRQPNMHNTADSILIMKYFQTDRQSFRPITPRVPYRSRSSLDITLPHQYTIPNWSRMQAIGCGVQICPGPVAAHTSGRAWNIDLAPFRPRRTVQRTEAMGKANA